MQDDYAHSLLLFPYVYTRPEETAKKYDLLKG
jgi:hypothetical protein